MRRPVAWALASLCLLALPGATRGESTPVQPNSPAVLLIERGHAALEAGDTISSLSRFREAIARAPRDPRGYVALGGAYLSVHEPKNALEVFEAGARNTRGAQELSLGLARTYTALGQGQRALATLRAAASHPGVSRAVLVALAEQAEQSGAFVEALAARRAALSRLREAEGTTDEARRVAHTRVAALQLLVGRADRLRKEQCGERTESSVLAALRDCPRAP